MQIERRQCSLYGLMLSQLQLIEFEVCVIHKNPAWFVSHGVNKTEALVMHKHLTKIRSNAVTTADQLLGRLDQFG